MAFLTINGHTIDVYHDGFDRETTDVQTFNRTEGMSYEGALYAAKRQWAFTIPWEPSEQKSISDRDWIKGRGHYWTFERVDGATTRFNKYSADGGPGFDANIGAGTAYHGTHGAKINSGDSSTVTVGFGSEGRHSVSVWKRNSSSSYVLMTFVYNGTATSYFASNANGTTATAAFPWMSYSAVSGSMTVTLQGENEGGTSATTHYDGLWVVPYALTTPQITARLNRTAAEPVFPHVEMDGTCLEDIYAITVKGFVLGEEMTEVRSGGTAAFARMLKVQLVEK